ncbi:hypothetical protein VP01_5325g1, partial [Puccinia sorghi]
LFDIIKCSSETEVISKNNLLTQPVHWRSSEFSKLARSLKKSTSPKFSPCKDHNISKLLTLNISRNLLTPPLPTPSLIRFHTTCSSTSTS